MSAHKSVQRIAVLVSMVSALVIANSAAASVVISSDPTSGVTCAQGVCTTTAKKAVLNVSDLAAMLGSGDVQVLSGSAAKDIEIKAPLSWTSVSRLTLDSFHSILFEKPVVLAGSGNLIITTNDGGSGGDFSFNDKGHIEFQDLNVNPIINGNVYGLVDRISELARVLRHNKYIALAKSINVAHRLYTKPPVPNLYGTLEGFGNVISDFTLNDSVPSDVCVALIGCVDPGGSPVVRDLQMKGANVTASQFGQYAGILEGAADGQIVGCSTSGQVLASGDNAHAGGIAGEIAGGAAVIRSSSSADVSATGSESDAGGLAGATAGTVDQTFASGTVSLINDSSAGGLIGVQLDGTVSNSYATGAVSGDDNDIVGGFIASNTAGRHISTSYSSGGVTGGGGSTVGGFIGEDMTSGGLVDVYWDLDTSGVSDAGEGAGNIPNDPGITGLTTAQFQSSLPSGLNKSIWGQKSRVNAGYPYLLSLPPK